MPNKRIRDLDLQSTPNEDDSIPVDHSSYIETKKVQISQIRAMYRGTSEPTNTDVLWLNTNNDIVYRYSGGTSTWISLDGETGPSGTDGTNGRDGYGILSGTTSPSTGGTIWYNTTNEQFYINENGSWVKPRTYNDIFSLPINLNYDEGTNAPFFKKTSTANCTETFVSNTDLYSDYYEYKRRWTGTGIGSCFIYQTHFDIMTTGNTIFSWGFWVKDSDILDVMTTSKNFEYWLYHGGILTNPSYEIKTIIEGDVGTRLSGTDTSTNLTSCKWESYSIDRKSGYTYIVNNIYDMVWNPSFTISNLYFYIIFNDFDELLNGKTIDTIGHTILIDEKISKPYVYPDINGKQQYPFNIEDNYNKIVDLDTRVSVLEAGIDTGTTSDTFVRLDLPYLYVRTHLNDTQDLLQVFNVNLTSGNSQVNFNAEYIFPSGTSYTTATMTNSANLVKSSGDDACPSNYNSTYIGANHGPSKGITVTSHTHGKDDTDVGSVYRDVDLVEWTILKIVDADTLVVISENIGASSEIWNYDTSINGDLTNYIGGTHTGDITVDSQVFGLQLKPIIKNHTIKYLIDGKTDIYGIEGDYYCDYINIVEEYDICNIESSVEYVRNNPGVAQELINGDAQVHQQVMYKIKNNGCDIYTSWTTKQSVNIGYFGFIQSANVYTTLYDSYLMVPNTTVLGDGKDFSSWYWWTTGMTEATFNSSVAIDDANPPARYSFLMKDGSTEKYTLNYGFYNNLGVNNGISGDRNTLNNNYITAYTTGKIYPRGIDLALGQITSGNTYVSYNYKIYKSLEYDEINLSNIYSYITELNNSVYIYIDVLEAYDYAYIKIPPEYIGMTITELNSYNVTLLNDVVSSDSIIFSGGKGFLELKLR